MIFFKKVLDRYPVIKHEQVLTLLADVHLGVGLDVNDALGLTRDGGSYVLVTPLNLAACNSFCQGLQSIKSELMLDISG